MQCIWISSVIPTVTFQFHVDFLKIVDSSNLSYHYCMLLHMCIYKASWEILAGWPWDESRWSKRNHYVLQNSLTVLVFFKIYLILNIFFCHIYLVFWIKIIQLKSSIISCYVIHLFFVLFWGFFLGGRGSFCCKSVFYSSQ